MTLCLSLTLRGLLRQPRLGRQGRPNLKSVHLALNQEADHTEALERALAGMSRLRNHLRLTTHRLRLTTAGAVGAATRRPLTAEAIRLRTAGRLRAIPVARAAIKQHSFLGPVNAELVLLVRRIYFMKSPNLIARLQRLGRQTRRAIAYSFKVKRVGFHTFWTRPMKEIKLPDYELLTMIASALTYRKYNGPMHLYTDTRGMDWLSDQGLLSIYDVVHTSLDDIPEELNHDIFWAGGKLYAYHQCKAPCISIDYDAVVWKRLPFLKDDAVALHPEPTNWGGYRNTEDLLSQFGFHPDEWSWDTEAANMGVVVFNDEELKAFFTKRAIDFMLEYSKSGRKRATYEGLFGPGIYTSVEEMIFAEQRLLMMCADKTYKTVGFMTGFDRAKEHIQLNDQVTHLWNSKRGYKVHSEARKAFCNYMLNYLIQEFPKTLDLLPKLNLAANIIFDANVPVHRFGYEGDWALPGEQHFKL